MTQIDKEIHVHPSATNLLSLFYPLILLTQFLLSLHLTWRKWPDLLVDFGRELYVPWRLSAGEVLYRDIAHVFGPLSQYSYALLFKIFGVSLSTIIAANIAILAFFITGLYLIIAKASSKFTGFICCSVIMAIFTFSQYVGIGNYNFINPYSHEATHGMVLSLFMIHQLWQFNTKRHRYNLHLAGFIFGLIFLTKIEIVLSCMTVVAFFFLIEWQTGRDIKRTLKSSAGFLIAASIPVLLFFSYFACVMPVKSALTGVCGSWISLTKDTGIATNKFYLNIIGLDSPFVNLVKMVSHSAIAITTLITILFLCYSINKHKNSLPYVCLCAGLLGIIITLAFFLNPYEIGRVLPVGTIIAFLFLFFQRQKLLKSSPGYADTLLIMLLWSVFSMAMLWKMVLYSKFFHYGFILALPATALLVAMLVWYLPEWFEMRFSGGTIVRIVMVMIIAIISMKFIQVSGNYYGRKNFQAGTGADKIITYDPRYDSQGPVTVGTLQWISSNIGENETFAALPEGIMLNYLSRRRNPTPYPTLTLPEVQAFTEVSILMAFKKNPPDYILLVHKNTAEYGVGFFGQDARYGKKIMDWIMDRYYPVCLFGAEPLRDGRFGIKIAKKKPAEDK